MIEKWLPIGKWFLIGTGVLFFGGLSARGLAELLEWQVGLKDWWKFIGFLAVFSLGGGAAVGVWGLGNPRRPRWGRGLVALAVVLFGLLVWPTPFKYYKPPGEKELVQVNRITGDTVTIYKVEPSLKTGDKDESGKQPEKQPEK